jgi:hypothetical protein
MFPYVTSLPFSSNSHGYKTPVLDGAPGIVDVRVREDAGRESSRGSKARNKQTFSHRALSKVTLESRATKQASGVRSPFTSLIVAPARSDEMSLKCDFELSIKPCHEVQYTVA